MEEKKIVRRTISSTLDQKLMKVVGIHLPSGLRMVPELTDPYMTIIQQLNQQQLYMAYPKSIHAHL